jgi:hypothetical protein
VLRQEGANQHSNKFFYYYIEQIASGLCCRIVAYSCTCKSTKMTIHGHSVCFNWAHLDGCERIHEEHNSRRCIQSTRSILTSRYTCCHQEFNHLKIVNEENLVFFLFVGNLTQSVPSKLNNGGGTSHVQAECITLRCGIDVKCITLTSGMSLCSSVAINAVF